MRARSNLPAFPLSLSSRKGRGKVLGKRHMSANIKDNIDANPNANPNANLGG